MPVPDDLRLYYLDDNNALSAPDYDTYRRNCIWRLWNRRITSDGDPGTDNYITDQSGYQNVNNLYDGTQVGPFENRGKSMQLLTGRYEDFVISPVSSPLPGSLKDFIVDIEDALIVGYPFWQYTWFAIENTSSIDIVRLQIENIASNANPQFSSEFIDIGNSFAYTKLLGIKSGTGNLTGWTTQGATPTLGTGFPHYVAYNGGIGNVGQIYWNALTENAVYSNSTVERTIYHGYNNRKSFVVPGVTNTFKPYQIAGWSYQDDLARNTASDGSPNFPNTSKQTFDLPQNHTLFGVIIYTRDGARNQNGTGTPAIQSVNTKGWKIFTSQIKFSYLVLS